MGANFACHFCENTKKPFDCCTRANFKLNNCFCCCVGNSNVHEPTNGINITEQLVLLPNQFKCDNWIILDDIPFTTTTVFFHDTEKRLRALIHHEPRERLHRLSIGNKTEEQKAYDVQCGELLEDILPAHVRAHLMYIMNDTLIEGHYYQLNGLFNGQSRLIRTFPLPDSNGKIVAGVMMIGIFTQAFNSQLNQFVINPSRLGVPTPVDEAKRKSIDHEVQQIRQIEHLGKLTKWGGKTL